MQNMTIKPGKTALEIYVIFRVFNIEQSNVGLAIHLDPQRERELKVLNFTETKNWTVSARPCSGKLSTQ
jgi:hypothetical protein